MLIAAMLMQAASLPAAETEALGVRLARVASIDLLPAISVTRTDDFDSFPTLTEQEAAELRRIEQDVTAAAQERLVVAMGHAYARRLSVSDLRRLVASAESDEQKRLRAIAPEVISEASTALDGRDLGQEVKAIFCRRTGNLCNPASPPALRTPVPK